MFLDDNPDYQTVWQLAHNWANADPNETDTDAISPKLKEHIIRLISLRSTDLLDAKIPA